MPLHEPEVADFIQQQLPELQPALQRRDEDEFVQRMRAVAVGAEAVQRRHA